MRHKPNAYALITPDEYSGESVSQLSAERVAEPSGWSHVFIKVASQFSFDHA